MAKRGPAGFLKEWGRQDIISYPWLPVLAEWSLFFGINVLKRQERGKHGGELPPPQVIINALSPSQYFAV